MRQRDASFLDEDVAMLLWQPLPADLEPIAAATHVLRQRESTPLTRGGWV